MKKRLLCLLIVAVSLVALAACGPGTPIVTPAPQGTPAAGVATPSPTPLPGALTPSPLPTAAALPTPAATITPVPTPSPDPATIVDEVGDMKSYKGVIEAAEVVIMGKFVEFIGDDHAVRDIKDITKPNPNFHDNVKVYLFRVDAVYKGKVSVKEVKVAINYSTQNMKNDKEPKLDANFIEPELDVTYVLPLFYDKDLKWYINDQGIEPRCFKADKDDKLIFQTKNASVQKSWSSVTPITVSAFKKEADAAK